MKAGRLGIHSFKICIIVLFNLVPRAFPFTRREKPWERGCVLFIQCISHGVAQVTPKLPDVDWFTKGGLDDPEAESMMEEDDGNTFFYQKW